jgi:autotransporter-associated beta strand protein
MTTSGSGTLTLTGHASTPSGTWHVQQGTLAIGTGGSLNVGSLIQSAGSTLSLTPGTSETPASAPIQVSGAVQLAGSLTVTSLPTVPANGKGVLIHETGTRAISGTFAGLPQGAHLTVGGRQYTIDYAGGSGHDVVLTASAGAGATAAAAASSGAAAVNVADSRGSGGSGGSSILGIVGELAAAAVGASAVVLFLKRRRRGVGRRRRRPTGT